MVGKAWLAGAVLLVACGHARLVQRTPDAWSAVKTSLKAASTPEARSMVGQSCESAADALCTAASAVGCEM